MATFPAYPASTFQEATDLAVFASNQLRDFVNGDIATEIETEEGGLIPSVAKAMHEAAAYRTPIAWNNGDTEVDLMQPRDFNNTIYVPRTVPVTLGASPTTGPSGEWRILFRGAPTTITHATTNVQTAIDHTHLIDLSDVSSAALVGYDGTTSGLTATDVQGAMDEVSTTSATETRKGVAEVATQAETDAGTLDDKIVTPKKLRFGFGVSLNQRGYITFPSWMGGLIVQWGRDNNNGTDVTTFNFPLAFPTEVYTMVATDLKGTALTNNEPVNSPVIHIKSLTQFESVLDAATTNPNVFGWIAVGK